MRRKTHRRGRKGTHHRRHRMGAIGKGAVMHGLSVLAGTTIGVLAGRFINSSVSFSPTMLGVGEAVIGGAIAVKAKNPFVAAAGAGFGGNGLVYATGNAGLKLLPAAIGYGPDPMHRPARLMTGFRDVPKIGFPRPGAIGFPKPGAIGATEQERMRMARMYAGVY